MQGLWQRADSVNHSSSFATPSGLKALMAGNRFDHGDGAASGRSELHKGGRRRPQTNPPSLCSSVRQVWGKNGEADCSQVHAAVARARDPEDASAKLDELRQQIKAAQQQQRSNQLKEAAMCLLLGCMAGGGDSKRFQSVQIRLTEPRSLGATASATAVAEGPEAQGRLGPQCAVLAPRAAW